MNEPPINQTQMHAPPPIEDSDITKAMLSIENRKEGLEQLEKLAVIVLILITLTILCTLAGAWHRGEILLSIPRPAGLSGERTELLESHDNKFLLLKSEGERHQVLVQLPNQAQWWHVSKGDFTAANPDLSPNGNWVVYLSTQDKPLLAMSSVAQQQTVLTYTSVMLEDFGTQNNVPLTNVCPWTPIAWAANSARLAFFGCAEEPPQSLLLVADWLTPTMTLQPHVITGTVAAGTEPRQLLWMNVHQIAVTFPTGASTQPEYVRVFPVH